MIQARNKLSQEEISEAKKLINCCQNYDGTYRDPYLSNMLNFDPNMPAFFLYYEKGELVGLLTVYADDQDVEVNDTGSSRSSPSGDCACIVYYF